jgi:CheY-like chemotaxis protein
MAQNPTWTQKMSPAPLKRILLVEDDADIQEAMVELLVEEGFEVRAANNGAEAFRQLADVAFRPQLILLDLMMPIMDGHAFRNRQLQDPLYKAIPVVVISADRNAKEKSVQMQAAAFLAKPVNLDELLSTLATLGGR